MKRPAIPSCSLPMLMIGLVALLAACGSGPHLVVPTPRATDYAEARMLAVHAVSAESVFVVGAAIRAVEPGEGLPEGLILGSTDAGRSWRRLAYAGQDLAGVRFTSVTFQDRLRGWVGGIRTLPGGTRSVPVVFATQDGGNRWREVELLQDPRAIPTSVHRLRFESARRGQVSVDLQDPSDGAAYTSVYATTDAGRTWTVVTHRGTLIVPENTLISWVDARQQAGFRLQPTRLAGVTQVLATTSGGLDWTPRSLIDVADMDSWWGGAQSRR